MRSRPRDALSSIIRLGTSGPVVVAADQGKSAPISAIARAPAAAAVAARKAMPAALGAREKTSGPALPALALAALQARLAPVAHQRLPGLADSSAGGRPWRRLGNGRIPRLQCYGRQYAPWRCWRRGRQGDCLKRAYGDLHRREQPDPGQGRCRLMARNFLVLLAAAILALSPAVSVAWGQASTGAGGTPSAVASFSTWNSSLNPTLMAYTNANNTVTCSNCGSTTSATVGTASHASGHFYFEVTIGNNGNTCCFLVGVADLLSTQSEMRWGAMLMPAAG